MPEEQFWTHGPLIKEHGSWLAEPTEFITRFMGASGFIHVRFAHLVRPLSMGGLPKPNLMKHVRTSLKFILCVSVPLSRFPRSLSLCSLSTVLDFIRLLTCHDHHRGLLPFLLFSWAEQVSSPSVEASRGGAGVRVARRGHESHNQ